MQILESKTGSQMIGEGKHSFLPSPVSCAWQFPAKMLTREVAGPRVSYSSWAGLIFIYFFHIPWPWKTPPKETEVFKRDLGRNDSFWVYTAPVWHSHSAFESALDFSTKCQPDRAVAVRVWVLAPQWIVTWLCGHWEKWRIHGLRHLA